MENFIFRAVLEHLPSRTTRWDLLLIKLLGKLRRFPDISIRSCLNSNPSCHTLSKAFEIFKKLALTSRVRCSLKLADILSTIDSNWFLNESNGQNPD